MRFPAASFPAELIDSNRLAAQEDWRRKMRTLNPVGNQLSTSLPVLSI